MGIIRSSFTNGFSDKQSLFTEFLAQYKQTGSYVLLANIAYQMGWL
ncbi:MAG: hypothetical protein HRT53_17575 [Colwellia sp.]|nr:hypothetical protein [Colwellia sp.]